MTLLLSLEWVEKQERFGRAESLRMSRKNDAIGHIASKWKYDKRIGMKSNLVYTRHLICIVVSGTHLKCDDLNTRFQQQMEYINPKMKRGPRRLQMKKKIQKLQLEVYVMERTRKRRKKSRTNPFVMLNFYWCTVRTDLQSYGTFKYSHSVSSHIEQMHATLTEWNKCKWIKWIDRRQDVTTGICFVLMSMKMRLRMRKRLSSESLSISRRTLCNHLVLVSLVLLDFQY